MATARTLRSVLRRHDPLRSYRITGAFFFGAVAVARCSPSVGPALGIDFAVPFLDSTAANAIAQIVIKAKRTASASSSQAFVGAASLLSYGARPPHARHHRSDYRRRGIGDQAIDSADGPA